LNSGFDFLALIFIFDSKMRVNIREYNPSFELSPYIEFFWTGEFNINSNELLKQRVIPNGYIELIIHLSDSHCELFNSASFDSSPDYTLIGMYSQPYSVHFKDKVEVFGIRFKPEGFMQIFGIPAAEFYEGYVDIESLHLKDFRDFCRRLKELSTTENMITECHKYFFKKINGSKINLYYLNRAAEIIRKNDGLISIDELTRNVFIGKRQLEREFKQKLGLSPKKYMRLVRLNKVNRLIREGKRVDLSELSYICGFADQPHFIRDFKHFTGEAPKIFINKRDKFIVNPNISDFSQ